MIEEKVNNIIKLLNPTIKEIDQLNSLRDLGLDSLTIMRLIFELEEELQIVIPDDKITPEYFSDVKGVHRLIHEIINKGGERDG